MTASDAQGIYENTLDKNIDTYIYLGEGRNGTVYLMPDGKVIKLFKKRKNCIDEYHILSKAAGSKYFPRVYYCTDKYMVRDFVKGKTLPEYIAKKGLSKRLALNLIKLIEEFERLGFTRLDIRCEHIYVQEDESVVAIDPRGHYTKKLPFPKKMYMGLKSIGVHEKLLYVLERERPRSKWGKYLKKL